MSCNQDYVRVIDNTYCVTTHIINLMELQNVGWSSRLDSEKFNMHAQFLAYEYLEWITAV